MTTDTPVPVANEKALGIWTDIADALGSEEEYTSEQVRACVSAISTALEEAVRERDNFIERLQNEMSYLVKKHMEEPLMCVICGKKQDEVKKLIAGQFAQICNHCALVASDIVVTEALKEARLQEREECAKIVDDECACILSKQTSPPLSGAGTDMNEQDSAVMTLERIEANANLMRWCVHILGPDDVIAAPTHEAAVERAHELNLSIYERKHEPNDLLCFAYAAPWPHDDNSHWENLKDWAQ